MNSLALLSLFSVCGALLFLGAGYLLATARTHREPPLTLPASAPHVESVPAPAEHELAELQTELSRLRAQIRATTEIEERLQALQAEHDALTQKCLSAENKNSELDQRLEQERTQRETAARQEREQHARQIQELQKSREAEQKHHKILAQEVQSLQGKLANAQHHDQQSDQLRAEHQALSQKCRSAESRCRELERQLEQELRQQKEAAEKSLRELTNQVDAARAVTAEQALNIQSLTRQLNDARVSAKMADEQAREIQSLTRQLNDARVSAKMADEQAREIQSLTRQLNDARVSAKMADEQAREIQSLTRQLNDARVSAKMADEQAREIQALTRQLNDARESAKMADEQAREIQALTRQLNDSRESHRLELQESQTEAQEQARAFLREISGLKEQLNLAQDGYAKRFNQHLEKQEIERAALAQQLRDTQAEAASLQLELEQVREQLRLVHQQDERQQDERAALAQQLRDTQAEAASLQLQLEQVREQLRLVTAAQESRASDFTLNEASAPAAVLPDPDEDLPETVPPPSNALGELSDRIIRLEKQVVESLVDPTSSHSPEVTGLRRKIVSLEMELDGLRKKSGDPQQTRVRLERWCARDDSAPDPASPGEAAPSPNHILEAFGSCKGVKKAILADQDGLLLAGTGAPPDDQSLAAATVPVGELCHAINKLTPLGPIAQVLVVDEGGYSLCVMPTSSQQLTRTTWASMVLKKEPGDMDPTEALQAVRDRLARLDPVGGVSQAAPSLLQKNSQRAEVD